VLHFNHYDQMIQAAIDGQGVALGRNPLVERLIQQGRLTAPFGEKANASGAYFILTAPGAERREDVQHFVSWLANEVAAS
jgi:DNA-binding transcriptional LysR family regulator